MVAAMGRRPGNVDTRSEITAAAREVFAELGYSQATVRGIARRAAVDPALVHHYFTDKARLFVETMSLPADPYQVKEQASIPNGSTIGERVVERFLAQWEDGSDGPGSASFLAMAQAITASPAVAKAFREFLAERLQLGDTPGVDPQEWQWRRSLVSSQLTGLGWTRYVMQIEPLASAGRADVARWAGPTVDHYLFGDLPGSDPG
jgi:AcrR family transcriptional regulator